MDQSIQTVTPIKSALFVDFDNIYIGLSKTDPQAAEHFASDPSRWLAWLEKGLPARLPGGSKLETPRTRSILIRRCYPNPDAGFRRFRSFFTSSAFSVIDCPSLTRTGKNSSDIYMVMDILDTLSHKTYFDEFIIFSGDSDFMPVLLRLRAHDRRTTTLAIDFMPPAYKAACDLVISEEEFIEEALGVSHDSNCGAASRARVPLSILKQMATRVYDAVCSDGEVAGSSLPEILKDFREFRDSTNWLGFGTSQRLAEALVCSEPRLQLERINPLMYKLVLKVVGSRSEVYSPRSQPAASPVLVAEKQPAEKPPEKSVIEKHAVERPLKPEQARLRAQILETVKEMLAESRSALLLARVSQSVVSKLGPQVLESQWAGAGSFKRLLQNATDLGLEITTHPEPGYIYDPQRHSPPVSRRAKSTAAAEKAYEPEHLSPEMAESAPEDEQPNQPAALTEGNGASDSSLDWLPPAFPPEENSEEEDETETYQEALPSLEDFVHRVSRVTGAPDLSPRQYALVFHGMVNELRQISEGEKNYTTYQSSKAVSDWCSEHGETIPRGDVGLIFKAIIFQDGVRFSKRPGSYSEQELANMIRNNIKALCQRSQLELSEYEDRLLDEWILSGLEEIDAAEESDR